MDEIKIEIGGDNLFDQIDDLLEFPTDDDVDSEVFGAVVGDCAGFHTVWPEDEKDLPEYSGCCTRSDTITASDISTQLFVPYEDIVQLDWLPTFVEDSFSGGGSTPEKTQTTCSENKDSFQNRFQTSSPVSVLESSSNSFSGGRTVPVSHEKRARSKRPRPATFSPRGSIPLIAPGQPAPVMSHQIKKIKILPPSGSGALHLTTQIQEQIREQEQNLNAATIRKCKHCGITKTPQWRSGPMGPKSLCNACGVRYKSGRLYPEYRPAASPTFVPSLHSNSHKKVLEMRGCN